jgi:ribosome modulation factor
METAQATTGETQMTIAMQNLTAFERGQDDYLAGRRVCPFTVQSRVEAWLDGWRTQQEMYLRNRAA